MCGQSINWENKTNSVYIWWSTFLVFNLKERSLLSGIELWDTGILFFLQKPALKLLRILSRKPYLSLPKQSLCFTLWRINSSSSPTYKADTFHSCCKEGIQPLNWTMVLVGHRARFKEWRITFLSHVQIISQLLSLQPT